MKKANPNSKGNGKSVPSLKVLKTPLRDGDLERPDDAAYADSYFVNANSATAPGIVDMDCQPILERSEVTAASMAVPALTSMHLIPTAIRELPAVLTTCRRLPMENLLEESPEQRIFCSR